MRELTQSEVNNIHGGFVITASVTLIVSAVIAGIYLVNTLINLYMVEKTGKASPSPTSTDINQNVSQISNDIGTIAKVVETIHH